MTVIILKITILKVDKILSNICLISFSMFSFQKPTPCTASPILTQAQSPISTRSQLMGANYHGISGSNSSFPSGDYVTQASEIGDWDSAHVRHDLVTAVSAAPSSSERRLVEVNSASGKTSAKEEWNSETGSATGK